MLRFEKPFTQLRFYDYDPKVTPREVNLEDISLDSSIEDKIVKWVSMQIY